MAKLFDAVNRLRKVEEATSSRDEPPPVYLLDEIWEMAREGGDSAISIAEHLNRNLGNRSPVVKWKALRVIKHLCGRGAPQFQRSMQRFANSIRELTHYKGEPDPFKGDANNARVRDLANEVLALLYSSSAPSQTSSLQGRIQGFGSSMPPPPGPGGTGGRMMAFGSNTGGVPTGGWGPSGTTSSSSSATGNRGAFMGNSQTAPSHNRSGSFGDSSSYGTFGGSTAGGARGNGMTASLTATSNSSSYFGPPPTSSSSARSGSGATHAPSAMLGSEQGLVDDITASGGLRAIPSQEDLKQFVEAASNMDGLKIAELMMGKLTSSNWQVVLRTLCALEAVLQQGMTQACGEIAVMFQSDPGCVRAALTSPQQAVRQQAAKCLKLLVNEDVDSEAAVGRGAAAGAAHQPGAGFPDLMGGDDSTTAAQPKERPAPADPFDLLGDLTVPAPAPAPAAGPAFAVAPVAAPAAANTNHLDFLGGSPGPAGRLPPPAGGTVAPVPAAFDPFAPLGGPSAAPVPAVQPGVQGQGYPGMGVPPVQNKPATGAAPLEDIFSSLTVSAGGQVSLGPGMPGLPNTGFNNFQQGPLGQQPVQVQGGMGGWGANPLGASGQPGMLGMNGGASLPFGDLGMGKPQGFGQQVQPVPYMQQQQQQRPLPGVGGTTSSWQSSLPGSHAGKAEQDKAFDFVKDAFN